VYCGEIVKKTTSGPKNRTRIICKKTPFQTMGHQFGGLQVGYHCSHSDLERATGVNRKEGKTWDPKTQLFVVGQGAEDGMTKKN